MNIWSIIAVTGCVLIIIGLFRYIHRAEFHRLTTSTAAAGILLPLFVAFTYADFLASDYFPGLNLLELSAFYFMGMISGFFLALILIKQKFSVKN